MEPGSDFEEIVVLSPNVLWAQRKETISLKVMIAEVKDPKIDITESSITFQAKGNGAKGWNLYKFTLQLFDKVDKEGCVYKVTPTSVDVQLTKQGQGSWWPKLVPRDTKKPHFLKLDFDHWTTESDEEEERLQNKAKEAMKDAKRSYEENVVDMIQKFYLTLYNGAQFIIFAIILGVCLFGRMRHGQDFYPKTYNTIGSMVLFAVLLSYLEALHPIMGFVKNPWHLAFVQVSGRTFAYFCLWLAGPENVPRCAVWYLFVTWSAVEVIRYPYYILQMYKKDVKVLTWLRYHVWVVLYPFGGYSEYSIIIAAARLFEAESRYELQLPNPLNFSISFPWFLRVYVVCFFFAVAGLMRHMWKMRQRKYGNRRKFKAA